MRNLSTVLLLTLACGCTADTETVAASAGVQGADPSGPEIKAASASTKQTEQTSMVKGTAQGLYALRTETLEGGPADLSEYAGLVTLVVNVASECGYTRQYAGLQELHTELGDKGFSVLAFPSNEFGGQEPGTAAEIRTFCSSNYGVTFPMFAKTEVKPGAAQSPVYSFLQEQTGSIPSWNFCKYLVGKDGAVIAFFKSGTEPDSADLRTAIENAL